MLFFDVFFGDRSDEVESEALLRVREFAARRLLALSQL
jgi:hypothetical protein